MKHSTLAVSLSLTLVVATLGSIGLPTTVLAGDRDSKVYPANLCQPIGSQLNRPHYGVDGGIYNLNTRALEIECPIPQDRMNEEGGGTSIMLLHTFDPFSAQLPSHLRWGCYEIQAYRNGNLSSRKDTRRPGNFEPNRSRGYIEESGGRISITVTCRLPGVAPSNPTAASGLLSIRVTEDELL